MIFVVAWCRVCGLPVGCLLISMHPMKKANRGRTAPYWLGAAQLKAGGSCPVGLKSPSLDSLFCVGERYIKKS